MSTTISESVQNYISEPHSDYAFMISGPWGIGKSYFWKNKIEPGLRANNKLKLIYISLYGVRDTNEINELIVNRLCCELAGVKSTESGFDFFWSVGARAVGGMFSKMLESVGVDTKLKEGSVAKFLEHLSTDCQVVMCFDDLERSLMGIDEVFGFVNRFVEHSRAKVFFLCNESELMKKHSDAYLRTKEKLVRITRDVPPASSETLQSIITRTTPEEVHGYLVQNLQVLEEYFRKCNTSNLRSFRFGITCISHCVLALRELRYEPSIELIHGLFPAVLEYHIGVIPLAALERILNGRPVGFIVWSKTDESNDPVIKAVGGYFKKYHLFRPAAELLLLPSFIGVVADGAIDRQLLKADLESLARFREENDSALKKVGFNPSVLEDNELRDLVDKSMVELRHGKFSTFRELIAAVNSLSLVSRNNWVQLSESELESAIRDCISQCSDRFPLRSEGLLEISRPFPVDLLPPAQMLIDLIEDKNKRVAETELYERFRTIAETDHSSISSLCEMLSEEKHLLRTQLNDFTNFDMMSSLVLSCTNEKLGRLERAIRRRYEQDRSNLGVDRPLLHELGAFVAKQVSESSPLPLRRYWLEQLASTLNELSSNTTSKT